MYTARTLYVTLLVHVRVGLALLIGHLNRGADLDERTFSNAGTKFRGLVPLRAIFDDFRPEGKSAALGRLGGVNAAAVVE